MQEDLKAFNLIGYVTPPMVHHDVRVGLKAAEGGALVTFGIVPTHAETTSKPAKRWMPMPLCPCSSL